MKRTKRIWRVRGGADPARNPPGTKPVVPVRI